jgi:hypothetical protein
MKTLPRILPFAALVMLLGWQSNVPAATGEDDKWHFITAPHVWAAGMDGDITVRGMTSDIDIGFDEILDHMEGSLMAYFELRKEKFGFYASPLYLKLSGGADSRRLDLDLEQELWIVEFGGFYNLGRFGNERPLTVDAIFGGRYWHNKIDTELTGPLIGERDDSNTTDLIDPLIGLRANQHLTDKISWSFRGDIGGFGISDDTSDFAWQTMGLLGYDFSRKFTLLAGYRALALDQEEGSGNNKHGLDIVMHGPIIGLEIRF